MFEITFTNPTDSEITYTAVGVVGHGLRPPTKATPGQPQGCTGHQDRDRRAGSSGRRDYAEVVLATDSPVTSRQTHLYRGHWFDALEVYWKDLNRPAPFADRDYGTADIAGGMGRNRDSKSGGGAMCAWRRGRAGPSALRLTWYAPNFRKYWITPVWHFRQPSPAQRPVEELVRDRVDRCRDRSPPRFCRAGTSYATNLRLPRRALSIHAAGVGDRCGGRQSLRSSSRRPPSGSRTARSMAGKDAIRLPLLRGQLHPCLELPAGVAFSLSGARAVDARGRLQLQHESAGGMSFRH